MNEFEKTKEQDLTAVNKRRSFLKKSATGAVIVSLPAKSAWGVCSVSGAMSGNLSTNADRHDCELPDLTPGRSPGFWHDPDTGIHGAFTQLKNVHDNKRQCYINEIKSFIASNSMGLDTEVFTGNDSLAACLSNPGGVMWNLAAVYLNAYYGFYPTMVTAGSKADASALVNNIMLWIYTQEQKGESSYIPEAFWNFEANPEPTSDVVVTYSTNCSAN